MNLIYEQLLSVCSGKKKEKKVDIQYLHLISSLYILQKKHEGQCKIEDLWVGWWLYNRSQRLNLNKLHKGPLADLIWQICKLWNLWFLKRRFFKIHLHISPCKIGDPKGRGQF